MKQVCSFSGGRTSAYMMKLLHDKYGDDLDCIYLDTGAEHPNTYKFIRDCSEKFGIPITCLRVVVHPTLGEGNSYEIVPITDIKCDLAPFKAMVDKYGTPFYPTGRLCTARMKTEPFTKYCDEKYGKGNYTKWLGIRVDEPRRLTPKPNVQYLADISDFDKKDILSWWEEQDFNLEIEEWMGNCVFCIQKKSAKIALAARQEPELAKEFMEIIKNARQRGDRPKDLIYQHNYSLEGIIASWKMHSEESILESVIRGKRSDTGSCSESCEVFSDT